MDNVVPRLPRYKIMRSKHLSLEHDVPRRRTATIRLLITRSHDHNCMIKNGPPNIATSAQCNSMNNGNKPDQASYKINRMIQNNKKKL